MTSSPDELPATYGFYLSDEPPIRAIVDIVATAVGLTVAADPDPDLKAILDENLYGFEPRGCIQISRGMFSRFSTAVFVALPEHTFFILPDHLFVALRLATQLRCQIITDEPYGYPDVNPCRWTFIDRDGSLYIADEYPDHDDAAEGPMLDHENMKPFTYPFLPPR